MIDFFTKTNIRILQFTYNFTQLLYLACVITTGKNLLIISLYYFRTQISFLFLFLN